MELISSISSFLLILIFSPFVTEMVVTVVDRVPIDWGVRSHSVVLLLEALLEIPTWKEIKPNFGQLVGTIIWSNGGFDTMGAIAGEVSGGHKSFLLGISSDYSYSLKEFLEHFP
jgi:hypothetical protein